MIVRRGIRSFWKICNPRGLGREVRGGRKDDSSIPLLCDCRSLLERFPFRWIYVPCVDFYAEAKLVSSSLLASDNMIETVIPDAGFIAGFLPYFERSWLIYFVTPYKSAESNIVQLYLLDLR